MRDRHLKFNRCCVGCGANHGLCGAASSVMLVGNGVRLSYFSERGLAVCVFSSVNCVVVSDSRKGFRCGRITEAMLSLGRAITCCSL